MWSEKKFVVEIDEKYVDQKKTPNSNVHNRRGIRQKYIFQLFNENFKNKLSDVHHKKKYYFFAEVKKVCNQQKL